MLKARVETEFDGRDWDNILQRTPASNAFQMSKNYEPYRLAFGSVPLYVTAEDSSGNVLGQLLAVSHPKMLTRSPDTIIQSLASRLNIGSMISWAYGPVIHDNERAPEVTGKILHALDEYCRDNRILMARGSTAATSDISVLEQYPRFAYASSRWDTWITRLDREAGEIYGSLHNKTRYDVRRGEKNGLSFKVVNDREYLDEWMRIKFSGNRHLDALIKKYEKFNDHTWEILYKGGLEGMFLAMADGNVVGGIANKFFNRNVIQHAVINSDAKLQGGSFLTWNTIKWSGENGFLTYDMGGANPSPVSAKEEGIRHFKSKWGGEKYGLALVTRVFDKNRLRIFKTMNSPGLAISRIRRLVR